MIKLFLLPNRMKY